jgi:hypothetical protein
VRRVWNIAGSTISAVFTEKTQINRPWIDVMASHEVSAPIVTPADLELEFVEASELWNADRVTRVEVHEMVTGGCRRVVISHTMVAGEIIGEKCKYHGTFELFGPREESGPCDIATRTALSFVFEDEGNLLFHASGVLRPEGVWLFVGPNRSGKTTIATELYKDGEPLAVDRSVVTFDAVGKPSAHSTPFSDTTCVLDRPLSGPIAGLCCIEQAAEHGVRRMETFEATRALLKQTTAYSRDRIRVGRTMEAIGRLAESGLCFHLRFAKNDGFWPLLESAKRGSV